MESGQRVRAATLQEYYADPHVRTRIREYCGDSGGGAMSCVYLTGLKGTESPFVTWDGAPRHPVGALDSLMAAGADIARSTWDVANLLLHLDIDYQNTDFPGEAYYHPAEVFFKLEPVYRAVTHELRRFALPLLPLMTGQGYHFTGRVPLDSDVIRLVADLVPDPPHWLESVSTRRPPWTTAEVTPQHARAYVGAGLLIEFLAHQILRRAVRRTPVPIVLNGTFVGNGLVGRECVSLDLSSFGDPMDARHLRVAFGAYQKHRFRPDVVGHRVAEERPPFVAVPRHAESLANLLSDGRDLRHAARAARSQPAALPEVSHGVRALVGVYRRSRLAAFHHSFYATPRRSDDDRDDLFESLRASALPTCVGRPLLAPNDLLLQPARVQHVTRWLTADGMRARDIAAIVHSRYASDCGWGDRWLWLDAETRAEFDVRVFAGLLAAGLDRAVDFNCRSAQEKGLCPTPHCERDLRVDRKRLLENVDA
jgi:hypothetical protein